MKAYIKAPEFGEAQKTQEHHLQDVISDNLSPQLVGVSWGCLEGVWWVCLWGGVSEDIWRVLGVSLSGCILSSLWGCLHRCHSRKYFNKKSCPKFWNLQRLLEIPTRCSCGALQSP